MYGSLGSEALVGNPLLQGLVQRIVGKVLEQRCSRHCKLHPAYLAHAVMPLFTSSHPFSPDAPPVPRRRSYASANQTLNQSHLLQRLESSLRQSSNDVRYCIVRSLSGARTKLYFFPVTSPEEPLIGRPADITAIEEVRPNEVDQLYRQNKLAANPFY